MTEETREDKTEESTYAALRTEEDKRIGKLLSELRVERDDYTHWPALDNISDQFAAYLHTALSEVQITTGGALPPQVAHKVMREHMKHVVEMGYMLGRQLALDGDELIQHDCASQVEEFFAGFGGDLGTVFKEAMSSAADLIDRLFGAPEEPRKGERVRAEDGGLEEWDGEKWVRVEDKEEAPMEEQ